MRGGREGGYLPSGVSVASGRDGLMRRSGPAAVGRLPSMPGVYSAHEAVWLERNLLESSLPPWNRTPGGQESAMYIRLDAGPVKPGLSVAFQALPQVQALFRPLSGQPASAACRLRAE